MGKADAARLRPIKSAVTIAPDWLTNATRPRLGARCAKLALRPAPGTMTPMQFGPTTRSK